MTKREKYLQFVFEEEYTQIRSTALKGAFRKGWESAPGDSNPYPDKRTTANRTTFSRGMREEWFRARGVRMGAERLFKSFE